MKGVGPQDVALAIIGATFGNGYVNNKVMEFVGPGVSKLSADFRIGIDVMTTETTCLSSIWKTDDQIREFYEIHGRTEDYMEEVKITKNSTREMLLTMTVWYM
jgi:aconitate hydratase